MPTCKEGEYCLFSRFAIDNLLDGDLFNRATSQTWICRQYGEQRFALSPSMVQVIAKEKHSCQIVPA
jgi:hypothetical protein